MRFLEKINQTLEEITNNFFENCLEIFFWWAQKIDTPNNSEIFLDGRNFLELFFFSIVDPIRGFFRCKIDRNKRGFFDKYLVDSLIIFVVFFILSGFTIFIRQFGGDFNTEFFINQFFQYGVFIILLAILWTGHIYLNEQFRFLIRTKFLPVFNQNNLKRSIFFRVLDPFFNGFYCNKNGSRFYLRSLLILLLVLTVTITFGIIGIPYLPNIYLFPTAIFNLFLVSLLFIVTFYVCLTIFMILLYLAFSVRIIPLEIHPLIDRGGTKIFGNICINCLYLSSIAIGFFPFIYLFKNFNLNLLKMSELTHQPFGNITNSTRGIIVQSINNASINGFWNYLGYLIVFLSFFILALIIIVSLHYRIKQKKIEELRRIEEMISIIDVTQLNENTITEEKKNLIAIYDRILNLHDWPTKNITAISILLSLLPIFISYTLSKIIG